jgi:hypothetical protein
VIGLARSAIALAAGAGLVLVAAHAPASIDLGPAGAAQHTPSPRDVPVSRAAVVCPGPETIGVDGVAGGSQAVDLWAGTAPAGLLPAAARASGGGQVAATGLPGAALGTVTTRGAALSSHTSRAQAVLVAGSQALAPGVAATQRTLETRGDARALATTVCRPAAAQAWLIGGGGEAGRRKRVVLANPGPNPVSVDLTVLGADGPVSSPNGRGIVVAPRSRTVVLLDAISGTEKSPVVGVSAHGGEVSAVLSDAWLDGVVPRGADDALPSAAPAREQVVPGAAVDGPSLLRVAVPGDSEAVVQARVLTPQGARALPGNAVVRVGAHSTRDIDLSALPADAYAVQVRADVPVLAGVMMQRRKAGNGPSDLAWSTATPAIAGLAGTTLPTGPSAVPVASELQLVATGKDASVSVTTVTPAGVATTQTVPVPVDTTVRKVLTGAGAVWLSSTGGSLRAAVVTTASDATGPLLGVTPLYDVPLTTTPLALQESRD